MNDLDIRPAIMTNGIKLLMTFIDRIGFPILAFLLMWYQNRELNKTITQLNSTLIAQTEILRRLDYKTK